MLKFWLDHDLRKGLHEDDVEIVEASSYEPDEDRDWIEPGPSLRDIEAMQRHIREQFPLGWRIVNGRVRAYSRSGVTLNFH